MTATSQTPLRTTPRLSRRAILGWLPLSSLLAACKSAPPPAPTPPPKPRDPIAKAAPLVHREVIWRVGYYLDFIAALPPSGVLALKKSLGRVPFEANESALKGTQTDLVEIASSLCQASSWFGYCRNPADFDYHGMVGKVADQAGVDASKLKLASTFDAEQLLMEKTFVDIEKSFVGQWEKMSLDERLKVLSRADPNEQVKDHAAIATKAGGSAIGSFNRLLKVASFLSGTSRPVVATTALGAASSSIGVTLPFAAYTSMTTAISVVIGPLGWAATAVNVFSVAWTSRPDTKKMAAFALTMHALKLDALRAADG